MKPPTEIGGSFSLLFFSECGVIHDLEFFRVMRKKFLRKIVELADVLQARRLEAVDEVTLRLVPLAVMPRGNVDDELAVDAVPVGRRDPRLCSAVLEDELTPDIIA